eukprot:1176559-Rhodomonas_salina.3
MGRGWTGSKRVLRQAGTQCGNVANEIRTAEKVVCGFIPASGRRVTGELRVRDCDAGARPTMPRC